MKLVRKDSPHAIVRAFDASPFLETERLGRIVEIHETIGSTNDRATQLAKEGAEAGVAVVALEQTRGRGQRGRTWHSPPGAGLYTSFVLRPKITPRLAPTITLIAGVAVRAALQSVSTTRLAIKWPNDVLVAEGPHFGRKLAGILVEASADTFRIEHAIVGIGVNISKITRPTEIQDSAIDLESLAPEVPDWGPLFAAIANELERRIYAAEMEGLEPIARTWTKHALGLGGPVTVRTGEETIAGTLEGIAEDGALTLQTASGRRPLYRGELEIPGVPKPRV
jgi:BirA family transcriptional regulator, biotin operon repressor / biotin---[acetyl-CoA-carboxylase] ligase